MTRGARILLVEDTVSVAGVSLECLRGAGDTLHRKRAAWCAAAE